VAIHSNRSLSVLTDNTAPERASVEQSKIFITRHHLHCHAFLIAYVGYELNADKGLKKSFHMYSLFNSVIEASYRVSSPSDRANINI
jgi:transcriptional regulator of met regulon